MRSVLHVSSLIALTIIVSLAPLPATGQSQTGERTRGSRRGYLTGSPICRGYGTIAP